MIGIYKITNKLNNHAYIGQSIDIEGRWKSHKTRAFNSSGREYEKVLYRAFRKYGVKNFKFEVLETIETLDETTKDKLNDLEKYYINLYDTCNNGYNESEGGDNTFGDHHGENHPKTKLTNEDVYNIRECYKNHEDKDKVFERYKNIIGDSGFKKIWNGYTWNNIHMDVYTEENKNYYKFIRNSKTSLRILEDDEIKSIRKRIKYGKEDWETIYDNEYFHLNKQQFKRMCFYETYKHLIV